MSISWPASLDGTAQFPQVSGTQTLSSPDHALASNNVHSLGTAIEAVLGTTAGTSVLKGFAAGNFPAIVNGAGATGTFQQTLTGTLNNSIFGTSAITGGTINNSVIGTPAITGGTATNSVLNNNTIGTPAVTGGTINSSVITPMSNYLSVLGTVVTTVGSTASASFVDITNLTVTGTTTRTTNILAMMHLNWYNNTSTGQGQAVILVDGTIQGNNPNLKSVAPGLANIQADSTAFCYLSAVAGGTHTIKGQYLSGNGGTEFIQWCDLLVEVFNA